MDGRYVTLGRLADLAGINPKTVYRIARSGRLPGAFRIGRSWRFDLDTLEAMTRPETGPQAAEPTEGAAS